jgi:uncharacterized protein (TIGR03435 family)
MKSFAPAIVGLIFASLVTVTRAPGQPTGDVRFDVTSVKPSNPDYRLRRTGFGCSGGRFLSLGTAPMRGILWAWDIDTKEFFFRVAGYPEWAKGVDAFVDIEARAGGPVSEAQCKLMVRNLYADRYHLVVHWEQREMPVFALVVAPRGPKLKKATAADEEVNGPGFTIDGAPMQMFDPNLKGWSMEQLAFALQVANLGRPVRDRTGLEGIYRIALSFSQRGTDGNGPDATTALEQQLGLRLESRKELVDVLVIDHMSKPDPN